MHCACAAAAAGHPASVDALAEFDADTLLTGSSDGVIRIVSILPNRMLGVVGEHDAYPVERLGLSHDRWVHCSDVRQALEGLQSGVLQLVT